MDLSTSYLGLNLSNPLMPGASPMSDDLEMVRRLEDAGAAAIVMHSLFEEHVMEGRLFDMDGRDWLWPGAFASCTPAAYLEQIRRIRTAVEIPVIASLNGTSAGEWLRQAALMEHAGADAIELNIMYTPTDPGQSGRAVEGRVLESLAMVKSIVTIPVAVKLTAGYSSLPSIAAELGFGGADGLVLFNRFRRYDPALPDAIELESRIRWLSILALQFGGSLACSGGVRFAADAARAILAGAHGVQLVSVLLSQGPGYLTILRDNLVRWMEQNGFDSVRQMRRVQSANEPGGDIAATQRFDAVRALRGFSRPD